jgi:hypothetical protein
LKAGSYNQCLWTGVAIFSHPNPNIDDSVKYSDGDVISAMPDSILTHQSTVRDTIRYVIDKDMYYFDESLVKKYQVNNIPLKVDSKKYPETVDINNNVANSFNLVYPSDMIDINIGSNVGLVSIIRKLYEQYGMADNSCTRYYTLNVDENIYYRILKVLYIIYQYCIRNV